MAQRKRLKVDIELDYELRPDDIARAFSVIGEDAKNWLKSEIVYSEDAGRRQMAREILGWAINYQEVTKIKRNVR